MKKLILLSLVLLPLLSISQSQVILKNGFIINEDVESFLRDELIFYKAIPFISSDRVKIADVAQLNGKIPEFRKKAILKKNPEVIFNLFPQQTIVSVDQGLSIAGQSIKSSTFAKMPGDFLKSAGSLYLAGEVLGVIGTGISFVAISDTGNINSGLVKLGAITSLAGGICVIIGHFQIVNAGKALNNASLTLVPTSSGIGLTLKF